MSKSHQPTVVATYPAWLLLFIIIPLIPLYIIARGIVVLHDIYVWLNR